MLTKGFQRRLTKRTMATGMKTKKPAIKKRNYSIRTENVMYTTSKVKQRKMRQRLVRILEWKKRE